MGFGMGFGWDGIWDSPNPINMGGKYNDEYENFLIFFIATVELVYK